MHTVSVPVPVPDNEIQPTCGADMLSEICGRVDTDGLSFVRPHPMKMPSLQNRRHAVDTRTLYA